MGLILKQFEFEYVQKQTYPEQLIEYTVLPFVANNIEHVFRFYEIFQSLPEFVDPFSLIIKMAVRICGIKLETFYIKILTVMLKAFGDNPHQNWKFLDTIADLFTYFRDSEVQKQWLSTNFSDLNNSLINYLSSQRDPDLLGKWIQILQSTYTSYPEYFLSAADIDKALEFILHSLFYCG